MNEKEYLEFIKQWKLEHEEEILDGRAIRVFDECLPKKNGFGANKNKMVVDWISSMGHYLHFIYCEFENDIKIKSYISKNQQVYIEYNNKEFLIKAPDMIKGKLGGIVGVKTSNFKIEISTRFQDGKRDITIVDRKYVENPYNKGRYLKYYKYKCNKCGFNGGRHYSPRDEEYKDEYWIEESNLLKGIGCSCCCFSPNIIVENKNSIVITSPWMIPIINDDEFCKTHARSCSDKIYPTCPVCGSKRNKLISINNLYKNHGFSCSCSDGVKYPNKFAFKMLEDLGMDFETEKVFNWCKFRFKNKVQKGFYDFYFKLNNKEYILEMDGGFHNKDNLMNGQTQEENKFIDLEKDRLALEHNIEVIRIDCDYFDIRNRFEYIKSNVLKNEVLNELFNLSEINWLKCEEFALSNLVKEACDYKRNNPELTTGDIGKIMKYNSNTILRWLKQGKKFGWCDFSTTKYLIILKDDKLLGIYSSSCELERKSLYDFNIKLDNRNIYDVCNRKIKTYKGYTFKYIKDLTEEEYIKYDIENKLIELNKTS